MKIVIHDHIGPVINENVSLFIPAAGCVIPSTQIFSAQRSCRVLKIAEQQCIVKSGGLMGTYLAMSKLIMGIPCGVKIVFNTSCYGKRVFEDGRASQEGKGS